MIKTLEYLIGTSSTGGATNSGNVVPATATTTSAGVCVGERRNLSVQMVTGAGGSGTVFTFDVSNDSVNWTPYNRLVENVTNTNAQNDTLVSSVTLTASENAIVFIRRDHFNYVRCTATITGGTPSTALLSAY
jgi:hypothetical protein